MPSDAGGSHRRASRLAPTGAVDLTRQAPTSGSYDGIDAMGLVWSMQPADGGMPDLFVSSLDVTALQISAEVPGEGTVGITLAREAIGEDVARSHVSDHDLVGELYMPPGPGPHPGVAVFPGSEGGLDSQAATAGLLASHGYAALVVGYFSVEGLETDLADIPLERLAHGIRWLREQPAVDADRVAALAVSKGSEGLLAATAHLDDVGLAALVAVSPSHAVWQAIGEHGPSPNQSSWTLAGAPLAYAPLDAEAIMPRPTPAPRILAFLDKHLGQGAFA